MIDADTGARRPLFDPAALEAALARIAGVTADEGPAAGAREDVRAGQGRAARSSWRRAATCTGLDLASARLTRLTTAAGKEEEPAWSPDARRIAFVRDNDLYVVDVATGREERLTSDGSPDILNGKLDWVYQEEIYGRGIFKAHWWSPDSSSIAFLQLDERGVPRFTLVDEIAEPLGVEVTPYPRPGEPNPKVRLGIVARRRRRDALGGPRAVRRGRAAGRRRRVDARRARSPTRCRTASRPGSTSTSPTRDGRSRKVLRETTRAWVDSHGSPQLAEGRDVPVAERARRVEARLSRRRATGTVLRQVTRGEWEARTLHGVDERAGWVYFSGTERSPIGGDVYRVRLDGSGLHAPVASAPAPTSRPSRRRWRATSDAWSDLTTPPQVRIHAADGTRGARDRRRAAGRPRRVSPPAGPSWCR